MARLKMRPQEKVQQFYFYLPPKLAETVKKYCKDNEIKISDHLKELIRAFHKPE